MTRKTEEPSNICQINPLLLHYGLVSLWALSCPMMGLLLVQMLLLLFPLPLKTRLLRHLFMLLLLLVQMSNISLASAAHVVPPHMLLLHWVPA